MSTLTFVQWIAGVFKIKAAEAAWVTLERMLREDPDPRPAEDPVYLRSPG
jgi:hypothetical protein